MTDTDKSQPPAAQAGKSKATIDLAFLGSPSLLRGEDSAAFEQLHAMVTDAVKPADFIEAVWVRDIIYLEWNILRLRKMNVDFIDYTYNDFGMTLTGGSLEPEEEDQVRARDFAKITVQNIGALGQLDRMVATTEARRNSTYREIERHKGTFADRLQSAAKQIIDVEYNEVTTVPIERKRAA